MTVHDPTYAVEARAPFDPDKPDRRVRKWGPPARVEQGPHGLCWANARAFASQDPGEYLYAEGIALNGGVWFDHAWVVRKSDGEVIECTASHRDTERYLGICWEVADVERLIDSRPLVGGETCRERWRTRDSDGNILSETPGVLAILAEELYEQGRHWEDYWNEREEWLDKGLSPRPGDPTA